MIPQPPPGQGPIDPRGAFSPPPPPQASPGAARGGAGGSPPPMPPSVPPQPPMGWMPPMMPPPGYFPPAAQAPSRVTTFARTIFFTLASTIFTMSLALNVYLLFAVGLTGGGGASFDREVVVDGDPTQTIAVIRIDGVINTETSRQFEGLLNAIADDRDVKAVVIELDTPGGEVTASDEIYERLKRFRAARGVKVVAAMGSMATSGGYYIACGADHLVAQPTTLTGNIGVVMQRFNFSQLMDQHGVKDTSITPAGSKFKNAESPFRPESPETAVYLRGIADDVYARFKGIVQAARSERLKAPLETVADGRAFTANEALSMGLVDQIGYSADAYAKAASLAGLTRQHVVRFERRAGLLESLGGGALSFGAGTDGRSSIPDVSIRLDSGLLDELTTPRLLYLYRGD